MLKEKQEERFNKILEEKGLKGRLNPKDPTIALFHAAGPPISHLCLLICNIAVNSFVDINYTNHIEKIDNITGNDMILCFRPNGTKKWIKSEYDTIMHWLIVFHLICLAIFGFERFFFSNI